MGILQKALSAKLCILASVGICSLGLSGCATAKAVDSPLTPKVALSVVSLDPYVEYIVTENTEFGPVDLPQLGKAVLHLRVQPPGLPVTIEQNPNLDRRYWFPVKPVQPDVLLEATPEYQLWQIVVQPISDDITLDNTKQFFRAVY